MCGNWNYTGHKLTKYLNPLIVRNGGLQQILTPVIRLKIASDHHHHLTQEFGGYPTLVNYNKDRERQYQKEKMHREHRENNRYLRNRCARLCGEGFPIPESSETKDLAGVTGINKDS